MRRILIDGGMRDLWSGSRRQLLEVGDDGAPADVVEALNRAVDLELVGDDAEAAGREWAFQWHPRYFHHALPERVDEMRDRIAAIADEHGSASPGIPSCARAASASARPR